MENIRLHPSPGEWAALTTRPGLAAEKLEKKVRAIIREVSLQGDEAVRQFSARFGGAAPGDLWVQPGEIRAAATRVDPLLKRSIRAARKNIERFHRSQAEPVRRIETVPGVVCWRKSIPIERVGLYIPGGTAPLFSTLLMLGIPARIAGCAQIVVATPPREDGRISDVILFVAGLLGIDKIYKAGGAQAIAAMACGTQTLHKVHKIFGPGNQYVTCAKKLVQAQGTAIDMLAGPSELAIYADATCVPAYVAADLLSQAEHGADSQVILVSSSEAIIRNVLKEVARQLPGLPRKRIIEKCLLNKRLVVFRDHRTAFAFLNAYAPEHLVIASQRAGVLSRLVTNAGSVFLGNHAPESAGDYASGTNHSLPTNGTAAVTGGVSLDSFVKKVTFQKITGSGIRRIGPVIEEMAEAEGLQAHRSAVRIRLQNEKRTS